MKLSEFLQLFDGMDENSEMSFRLDVGCCGDSEPLGNPDADEFNGYVFINFPTLDFLNSCRKYANARGKK